MRLEWFPASACDCQNSVPGQFDTAGLLTGKWKVEPIHPKAMPAILTTDEERDVWMRAQMAAEG